MLSMLITSVASANGLVLHPFIDSSVPVPTGSSNDYLSRKTIELTGNAEDAVCADGSPGVYYIRPGDSGNSTQWLIHLEGGDGGCDDGLSCFLHYLDYPETMSSVGDLSATSIGGLLDRTPVVAGSVPNRFADWNVVYVPDCTHDMFLGSQETVYYADVYELDVTIQHQGREIVKAVVRELQVPGVESDLFSGQADMPSLDDATHVVFSGSGGGAVGVIQTVDRLRAVLRQTNPGVAVRALVDSVVQPDPYTYCDRSVPGCPVFLDPADVDAELEATYDEMTTNWGAQFDASCLADNPGSEFVCSDPATAIEHLGTPVFIREDTGYGGLRSDFLWRWSLGSINFEDYERALYDRLDALGDHVGSSGQPTAVFAPRCSRGAALADTDRVWGHYLINPALQVFTTHRVIDEWLDGTANVVIEEFGWGLAVGLGSEDCS